MTARQFRANRRSTDRISTSMLARAAARLEMSVADLVGEALAAGIDSAPTLVTTRPDTADLLRAFSAAETPRMQAAILNLVRLACSNN